MTTMRMFKFELTCLPMEYIGKEDQKEHRVNFVF